MTDATPNPQLSHSGSLLVRLFSRVHSLAAIDAVLTALLWGGASTGVLLKLWHFEDDVTWAVLLGIIVVAVVYVVLRPESILTARLVSARKCALDGQITGEECEQQRKTFLRKTLLY